jgi:hypothetical protein
MIPVVSQKNPLNWYLYQDSVIFFNGTPCHSYTWASHSVVPRFLCVTSYFILFLKIPKKQKKNVLASVQTSDLLKNRVKYYFSTYGLHQNQITT